MMRYVRALGQTVLMALRGELMQPEPLDVWLNDVQRAVRAVEQAAQQQALDPALIQLTIDRRTLSMKTIVDTVAYHIEQEYPYARQQFGLNALMMMQAGNMDDHFRVLRLAGLPMLENTPTGAALARLAAILEAFPEDK